MHTSTFKQMINNYNNLLESAKAFQEVDLSKLSVSDYNATVKKAAGCQSKLDQFNIDLYHIIGMGNLSGSQLTKFAKLTKEIEAMRSKVKNIAAHKPVEIMTLSKESTFKLSCGVKLTNGGNK